MTPPISATRVTGFDVSFGLGDGTRNRACDATRADYEQTRPNQS